MESKKIDNRKTKSSGNKNKKSGKGTTVIIDEAGQMGLSTDKYFIMCADSTKKPREFANCTKKYGFPREMKFRNNAKQREHVLKDIKKLNPTVNTVLVKRPFLGWRGRDNKHVIHERALNRLAKKAIGGCKDENVEVIIDHTSMIEDKRACEICEKYAKDKNIKCKVVNSIDYHELQTHDMVVGAVGKKYNKNDNRYTEILGLRLHTTSVSPKIKRRK